MCERECVCVSVCACMCICVSLTVLNAAGESRDMLFMAASSGVSFCALLFFWSLASRCCCSSSSAVCLSCFFLSLCSRWCLSASLSPPGLVLRCSCSFRALSIRLVSRPGSPCAPLRSELWTGPAKVCRSGRTSRGRCVPRGRRYLRARR